MSNYGCRVTVRFTSGHTNVPYPPSKCSQMASAACGIDGRPLIWANSCWSRVTVRSWRSGDTCYIEQKCTGCVWQCGSRYCPGRFC
jgi:hypothetical protein